MPAAERSSRRAAATRLPRILVTAGPTREYVDPVRYISNDSSGRMGFSIAAAAAGAGCRVTLVHGPVQLDPPAGVRAVAVTSADQMLAACRARWPRHDVLIMAAAVADYRAAKPAARKIKRSRDQRVLKLRPTVDILATLSAERRAGQVVIGFALEDRNGRAEARGKLVRKGLDAIVLNSPAAISAGRAELDVLVRGRRWERWRGAPKAVLAARLVELACRLAAEAAALSAARGIEPRP